MEVSTCFCRRPPGIEYNFMIRHASRSLDARTAQELSCHDASHPLAPSWTSHMDDKAA